MSKVFGIRYFNAGMTNFQVEISIQHGRHAMKFIKPGNIRNLSTKTFGEILQNQTKVPPKVAKNGDIGDHKPLGYDVLESKFPTELKQFGSFLQREVRGGNKEQTKEDVAVLLEKYMNFGIASSTNSKPKKLTPVQKKMLMAAYSKAGKKPVTKTAEQSNDKIQKMKLGLIMKRNQAFLEYIAKSNGIVLKEDSTGANWTVENPLDEDLVEKDEEKFPETTNNVSKEEKERKRDVSKSDFNSLLRNLNKVHRTPAIHVLPHMTEFESHPTISRILAPTESEVRNIENFLKDAKKTGDQRDQLLFRAKTNYELSSTMIQRRPKMLENGNFFNPVCIPGTSVPLNEKMMMKTHRLQEQLKRELNDLQDFEVMKIYSDGVSGVLQNDGNAYWDGQIKSFYDIFFNVHDAQKFIRKYSHYLKYNWTPVVSDEKEIILVRNRKERRKVIFKRGVILFAVSLSVGLGAIGITKTI